MDLRYAGTCKVCGADAAGGRAGLLGRVGADGHLLGRLACCEADGLTEPVSTTVHAGTARYGPAEPHARRHCRAGAS